MLEVQARRELFVTGPAGGPPRPFSAASGLVQAGGHLYVVADDENHLGCFDHMHHGPGRLLRLFDGELPLPHAARKAVKADCEALLALPAFAGYACGALLAMGSGSRPSRQRAALLELDGSGMVCGPWRAVDLAPLFDPLHAQMADLNIEGAFIAGGRLFMLQRGNGRAGINALIEWNWADVQGWLCATRTAPRPRSVLRFELGDIDGVPLSFTDGAALPDGRWLFSAAAEDTRDTYTDGRCAGSAVGIVDAGGHIQALHRLRLKTKVEGVAVSVVGSSLQLLMVTDGDDRSRPALLLGACWPG